MKLADRSGEWRRPLVLLGAIVALLLVWAAAGVAPASAGNAPPCTPKLTKINGKRAAVNCGPATARLKIGGHTYNFRDGFCQTSSSAGAEISLDLGTLIVGAHGDAGYSYMSMLIPTADIDGSIFEADAGGKQVLGDSLIAYSGSPMKGSFTGEHTDVPFSGSWNCHGVIWHAP